jgi:hypothetical protein
VTEPTSLQGVAFKAMMKAATKQRAQRRIGAVKDDTYTLMELEKEFMEIEVASKLLSESGGS